MVAPKTPRSSKSAPRKSSASTGRAAAVTAPSPEVEVSAEVADATAVAPLRDTAGRKPAKVKAERAQDTADVAPAASEAGVEDESARERKARQMIRRQKRNMRKSWAEGYLLGICAMLRPGDLVIDCGANRGDISAQLAETGADVIAFEPDPDTFAGLTERLGHLPNVTLVHAAVGASAGKVRLMRAKNFADNPEGASVKSTILSGGRGIDDSQGFEVDLVDFPALVQEKFDAQGPIAFIKIDIEGAELELLEALEARGQFSQIRCLVAETHARKFPDLRERFRSLSARVAENHPPRHINLDWI